MGITDETDAVLVVVSEERGSISFCFNGNIVSDLDGPRLRAALEGVFSPKTKGPKRPGAERFWSMLPSQLLRRRSRTGTVSAGSQMPSEAPPPSVRIRATVPSGITSPAPSDTSPMPAATKPLRKTVSTKGGDTGKSVSPAAASIPPRAPDESS
jgi:hypothetical protein